MINFRVTCIMLMVVCFGAPAATGQADPLKSTISGTGPDIVFIPGLGCQGSVFNDLVANLSPKYSCHVLEIPGFAGQGVWNSTDAPDYSADVINYMQGHGLKQVTLVGHSFGGWLALQIASRSPLVKRLIIIDAVSFGAGLFQDLSPDQAARQAAQISSMLLGMSAEQYRAFEIQRMSMMVADPSWCKVLVEWMCATPRPLMAGLMSQMAGSDLRPLLPAIKIPTLVLASWAMGQQFGLDKSAMMNRIQTQYQTLSGIIIHLADKARHFIMQDEPQWLQQEIGSFLEKR